MHHLTKFQLIRRTTDSEIKFAQKIWNEKKSKKDKFQNHNQDKQCTKVPNFSWFGEHQVLWPEKLKKISTNIVVWMLQCTPELSFTQLVRQRHLESNLISVKY